MSAFHELPHDQRFAAREALEAAGCAVESYQGDYVQVHVAVGCEDAVDAAATTLGLIRDTERYYFPLGTDREPDHLRHDGPFGKYPKGNGGFTLNAYYRPARETDATR